MEASAHGGPPLLRQINSAHVVATLRGVGPLSLSDLATRTGLSRPTVGQVVDQLQASGLLAWVEPGQGRGRARTGRISGRPGPAGQPGWCGSGPRRPTWSASTSAGTRPWSPWPTWPGRSWPGTGRTRPGPAAAPTCWPCCAPPPAVRWPRRASGAPTWPASRPVPPAWWTGRGARSRWRPGCRAGRSSWPASCAARSAARSRWKTTPTWPRWPNGGTAWPAMRTRWSSSTGANGSAPAS